jgi:alcohol dehydrogenase class IV
MLDSILAPLEGRPRVDVETWQHPGGEPTLAQLDALLAAARGHDAQWVAAVGGGSVMDVAKAAAGLLHAPLPPARYHDGEPIEPTRIPFIAAPSTAGTGSEATIVSVLTNRDKTIKKSIRHPSFMPRLVILDPGLLAHCPPAVIAHSGMDAFTQAVESFVSAKSTWITDELSLKAVSLVNSSLEAVCHDPAVACAEDLMLGSTLAGMALSNARLGLVHGLAHPLGVRYRQPHGLVCAVCLPAVLDFNRSAAGAKFARLGDAVAADIEQRSRELLDRLEIASPFAGQAVIDQAGIIREALASGSTAANPRPVTEDDVAAVLGRLFE